MEPFILTRSLDAPKKLVWKVWTDEAHLAKWFGPKGFPIVHSKLDLREGGTYHYGMSLPNGMEMWGKWTFLKINEPDSLQLISSFSDKDGGVERHPFAPEWPAQMISKFTFEETDSKATVTIEWTPYEASASEEEVFNTNRSNMAQGWSGTFEQLEEYLKIQQS